MNIFKRIVRAIKVGDVYQTDKIAFENKLQECIKIVLKAEEEIKKRTSVHADISCNSKDLNHVIVIGKYHGGDYLKIHSFHAEQLKEVIEYLRACKRHYGKIKTVDAPRDLSWFIKDELRN